MNSSCPDCSKPLRNPKKCSCGWTISEKQAAPQFKPGCAAYGCRMTGSISHSVHGSNEWLCHMHFRAPASNWQKVTERIGQNSVLVSLINEIRAAQNGKPFDYRGWIASLMNNGHQEFIANDQDRRKNRTLSMRLWLDRLEKTLFSKVMAGMEEEEKTQGQSNNSEKIMEEIDAFLKAHVMKRAA